MKLIRALASLATVFLLTAGVPWLLLATVGNPIPEVSTLHWDGPVTNDAILGILALLAWLFWVQVVVCLVIETVAEIAVLTGRSARIAHLPGTFTGQRQLARVLVHSIAALGIGTVLAATPYRDTLAPAAATEEPSVPPAPVQVASVSPAQAPVASDGVNQTHTVTVAKGDSLWSLAEEHLGGGEHWREIADLNDGRTMIDGTQFIRSGAIQPGWTLLVPGANDETQPSTSTTAQLHVVQPGDSLWTISATEYGDGNRWTHIYQANHDEILDPDLIYPGQEFVLPRLHQKVDSTSHDGNGTDRATPEVELPTPLPARPDVPTVPVTPEATEPPVDVGDPTTDAQGDGSTLTTLLAGGGALLAAGAFAHLVARRHLQFRYRRSGRAIPRTPAAVIATDRMLRKAGPRALDDAHFLDLALRDLARRLRDHPDASALPEVAAARLSSDHLELRLAIPSVSLPAPWVSDSSGQHWTLSRSAELEAADALAPYPALASIGRDASGATWLLDLEHHAITTIAGDSQTSLALARYLAADLAANSWSDELTVKLNGFGEELADLDTYRVQVGQTNVVTELTKLARQVHDATDLLGHDVLTGRVTGRGGDAWMPSVALAIGADPDDIARLESELDTHPGRAAVALVLVGNGDSGDLVVDSDGALVLQPWGVQLAANLLSADDASSISTLLEHADQIHDEPIPSAEGDRAIDSISDAAGAIRDEFVIPRQEGPERSLLPQDDQVYLESAATTSEDLDALAPAMPAQTSGRVHRADPDLEADLAAWSDPESPRPKLRVLGPVEVWAKGDRTAEIQRRLSYYSEIVAYLATRAHGATPEGAAAEFGVQVSTVHSAVARVRRWLGPDPSTGTWYLPEATAGPSARTRGIGVYELTGILVDADLFRRLRARGQARGAEGIDDLVAALSLVEGRAFDQLRKDGYGWLAEDPLDHHLTAGIVDVAHIVATHSLANGDKDRARWAAEIGITAAPTDDKPRLDFAAATGLDLDTAPLSDDTYDDTPRTQAVKQNRKPGQLG